MCLYKIYFIVWLFFLLSLLIPIVIVLVSKLLNSPDKLIQKRSAYECGFMPISDSRKSFDIQFFITGILFLLFDVEIIFLFPWAITFNTLPLIGVSTGILFLFILVLGFIYEWNRGALYWFRFKY